MVEFRDEFHMLGVFLLGLFWDCFGCPCRGSASIPSKSFSLRMLSLLLGPERSPEGSLFNVVIAYINIPSLLGLHGLTISYYGVPH